MKILFLARRFWPDIGGVEKHVFEISTRLAAQGHTVTILTQSPQQKKTVSDAFQVITIPSAKGKKNTWVVWQWFWKNRKLIKKASVIHCHDVLFWYLPFRFIYPKKPVFTTFHGYESYPVRKTAIIVRKISELLSSGNICIGDFIKKWYGTNPTVVSYGAVEVTDFKPQLAKKIKKESAVFIGRLDDQTGIKTYLKAFEYIKKKYPKFEFVVVGDGKYKNIVEKKAKAVGFQKNPEKYLLRYNFAFVSRYLAILEAMAARKLVIAVYDDPIKEDYLKMAAFAPYIIIENSPQKIIRKIESLMHNQIIANKILDAAYQWVSKQTWENMVMLYLTLWKKKR